MFVFIIVIRAYRWLRLLMTFSPAAYIAPSSTMRASQQRMKLPGQYWFYHVLWLMCAVFSGIGFYCQALVCNQTNIHCYWGCSSLFCLFRSLLTYLLIFKTGYPSWPWTYHIAHTGFKLAPDLTVISNPPASASWVLILKAWDTTQLQLSPKRPNPGVFS